MAPSSRIRPLKSGLTLEAMPRKPRRFRESSSASHRGDYESPIGVDGFRYARSPRVTWKENGLRLFGNAHARYPPLLRRRPVAPRAASPPWGSRSGTFRQLQQVSTSSDDFAGRAGRLSISI